MVCVPGVSKYEFCLCVVWEVVVESVELENRPAKKEDSEQTDGDHFPKYLRLLPP